MLFRVLFLPFLITLGVVSNVSAKSEKPFRWEHIDRDTCDRSNQSCRDCQKCWEDLKKCGPSSIACQNDYNTCSNRACYKKVPLFKEKLQTVFQESRMRLFFLHF